MDGFLAGAALHSRASNRGFDTSRFRSLALGWIAVGDNPWVRKEMAENLSDVPKQDLTARCSPVHAHGLVSDDLLSEVLS